MGVNAYSPDSNLAYGPIREHGDSRHAESFDTLLDLNRQTIALLVNVAGTPLNDRVWLRWQMVGSELARLDTTQREDLARCRFSLVDPGFREITRWSRTDHAEPAQEELPFSPIRLQTRLDHLAHAAYLFAWHLVRSDVIAARLVFAMDSASTSLMTQVTLTDIRRVAQEQVRNGRVRPRWHNRPDNWSRLIHMAQSSRRDSFTNVTTRGLHLFLQELLTDKHGA